MCPTGPMKIIVGIGNPGKTYERTRHNLGFRVVDVLLRRAGLSCKARRFHSRIAEATAWGERLLLAKPQVYVNESGWAVGEAVRWYKIDLADLLVISDDYHLSVGRIKISRKGSAGGHNGLASIIEALGTHDFARLRLGIGVEQRRCDRDFVLSPFSAEEEQIVGGAVDRAADAVVAWLRQGVDHCMDLFNSRPEPSDKATKEEETT